MTTAADRTSGDPAHPDRAGEVRVAVVQLDASGDPASSRAAAVDAVESAAEAGAALVVLPEYASGWAPRLGPELAVADSFVPALQEAARRSGAAVVAGTVERGADQSRGRNVAVAIGADGSVSGTYAKVHLYDAFGVRESDFLDAGAPDDDGAPLVVDVIAPSGGVVRVGVLTCYDLRFPESARVLVDAGADVLAIGAAWAAGEHKADHLRTLARARAIENTSWLLLASQCGRGRTGRSAVIDPLGVVESEADGEAPAVVVADVSAARVARVRATNPALAHRRYAVVPRA
ncbi:Nitrilase/cyanide hydratase and apolipoprotein N-acyltransferase [Beutenbergia cavernae DSM 12333]|uniref:Nitrilase/cyanide hydratase and apolipoprotein N-acyltransferase n=1 Tax=Beutenbergia cavernae (strain ATCC BAA-8 / DSM 12333 / CCUG 43141 / JCM 11478 / NBRC 16432 / NCIMB 13614 / HKI 0122) TaxID=471853 RepID=C5C0T7_BEUC1|nr:nitrilase-related carbon-nitrogen hydrolase [Beutenbergia cavernae]ACQ79341.1 Nitrilase/cyanide hydratase and apolipoprotein N-acyltransferase [Beutenbergia cavernae DSM 12333]